MGHLQAHIQIESSNAMLDVYMTCTWRDPIKHNI